MRSRVRRCYSSSLLMLGLMAVLAGIGLALPTASPATIIGEIWQHVPASARDAGSIPAGPPDATFSTTAIDFDSRVSGYSLSQFLHSPAFADSSSHFNPDLPLNNIFLRLTGDLFLHAGTNILRVGPEDALILTIEDIGTFVHARDSADRLPADLAIAVPPDAGDGYHHFTLTYGKCCGPPAVLTFLPDDTPGRVPEPATWLLVTSGLAGVGGFAWFHRGRKPGIAGGLGHDETPGSVPAPGPSKGS